MINLIPNQEKKKMIKDFYYRLIVLALVMLCVSLLVAITALLPAYFLSNSKKNIAYEKLEIQKAEILPAFDQETREILKQINNKLNIIENAQDSKFIVSEKFVNAIVSKKNSDIKLTQISYENNISNGKKIHISGSASSRDVLLLFRKRLENSNSFKNVDLPISNFVRGSNIEFYLNLIPI